MFAMASKDQDRGERLQVMLSEEELTALDTWRFSRRMPSRAAAVREILRIGLSAEGIRHANQGQKSSTFGILGDGKVRTPDNSKDDS
jgi:hypothetical protein